VRPCRVGAIAREARGLFRGVSVWRVAFGAFGAGGFISAFGLTVAELETPGVLQGCGGGGCEVSHSKVRP
jgi:hypothetical protein